ncbi:MAG: CobD/CbiB family protein [Burkholderiales bacterium]
MTFLSLVLALLLEQWHPLVDRRAVNAPLIAWADFLERKLNAGGVQQGLLAWAAVVVPTVLLAWFVYSILYSVTPLLGLAFNVAVLYATTGFRQESHTFTEINRALREGELATARRLLGDYRGHSCDALSAGEVARLTIEGALTFSYRNVFGPMFWYVLLPGPTGAVLYRAASLLAQHWGDRVDPDFGGFGVFARRALAKLDWLPVRATAVSFAIVGDFADAFDCWRTQAATWRDQVLGVVLASGAGAMGVRIGAAYPSGEHVEERPELGTGELAEPAHLDATVGLIWRALVVWLGLLGVLSIVAAVS